MTEQEVVELLRQYHVPLEQWGTGDAKTIKHLMKELETGEIELRVEGDSLLRYSIGAAVYVYYNRDGIILFLKEEKQVFKDGRVKIRPIDTSVGEKMSDEEDSLDGAYRALEEELGITERLPLLRCQPVIRDRVPSVSFPGLKTYYYVHTFSVYLPDHLFKPEGYVEVQEDKTNYYVWVEK